MSDDSETPEEGKKKKGKKVGDSDGGGDSTPPSPPAPKDEEFFSWLGKLFSDDEFPEKLELRVVELRKSGKEVFGALVQQKLFRKNARIDNESIVALSNELLHLAQRDCNVQSRPILYGVYAVHFARENDYYERFLLRLEPNAKYGKHAPELALARDDDEAEPSTADKFSIQVLTHQQQMFQMYATGYEGMFDRADRIIERQDATIEKLSATIQRQNDMMERAMSMQAERDERARWTDIKIKGVERIIEFGATMAPPLLGQLLGKPVSGETPESVTLKKLFRVQADGGLLTQEQIDAVFGVYDEKTHAQLRPGVLTETQTKILWRVAQCEIPLDALDELLPGGACEVADEQFAALMQKCGLTLEQLAPIQIIFQGRINRKQAAAK